MMPALPLLLRQGFVPRPFAARLESVIVSGMHAGGCLGYEGEEGYLLGSGRTMMGWERAGRDGVGDEDGDRGGEGRETGWGMGMGIGEDMGEEGMGRRVWEVGNGWRGGMDGGRVWGRRVWN
jgi:hypothetical protein